MDCHVCEEKTQQVMTVMKVNDAVEAHACVDTDSEM